jgi:hypothetical protein
MSSFVPRHYDKVETLNLARSRRARWRIRLEHLQAQTQMAVDHGRSRNWDRGYIGRVTRRIRGHCAEDLAVFGQQREPGAMRQWPSRDLELDRFAATDRTRGCKFEYRRFLGAERARPGAEKAHRQRRDRQILPQFYRQFVLTVILATRGEVAVARRRVLGAAPGACSSGTTRMSTGTFVPAAAVTARFSGSGTVNVVGPWT